LVQSSVLEIQPEEARAIPGKADSVSPVGQKRLGVLCSVTTPLTRNSILRRSLNNSVFGVPFERWLLYSVYWSVNLILTLTKVDLHTLSYVRPFPPLLRIWLLYRFLTLISDSNF
jgi:hypothetical protein